MDKTMRVLQEGECQPAECFGEGNCLAAEFLEHPFFSEISMEFP